MAHEQQFYINGEWVDPSSSGLIDVIDPATEEVIARVAAGRAVDIDRAVATAKSAFPAFSRTTRKERLELLRSVHDVYKRRQDEVGDVMTREMGAPTKFSRSIQALMGTRHLAHMIEVVEKFPFEVMNGTTMLAREPVGVCGLITPWNWPINQIFCKIAPALAAGCTMVLKPSEIAPLNAILVTEILHEAGVPAGVFNLVNGDGPTAGEALAAHPDVDMVSFTGSTRAGVLVARAAAPTIKRVAQELGGKSANILLDDADFERAVTLGVAGCFTNCGQSCDAPTRMLVPAGRHAEVVAIARRAAEAFVVGDPRREETTLGPLVSETQFRKVQRLIEAGIGEGATLVTGGLGRPAHLQKGWFAKPTVFADVSNNMTIAREEIFGPVLAILPYKDEEEAIAIANDTAYGLAGYVQSGDLQRARRVASQLRVGSIRINYPPSDISAPHGGFKQSGNGREKGEFGLLEFLEVKAVIGFEAA